jgi:hypothetical protein
MREWLADVEAQPIRGHGAPRRKPTVLSRTDPASAWSAHTVRGRFGYAFNVMIDTPGGVAIEVEATPARFADEVDAASTMLSRAANCFEYRPKRLAADTAYGTGVFLKFVVDSRTSPHIPVMERSEQTFGKFSRALFHYDPECDHYVCPAGKVLRYRGAHLQAGCLRYCAKPDDCQVCSLKQKCTEAKFRSVSHSRHEDVREIARREMKTPLFQRSMRLRRGVERLFADAKTKRGLARLHLRGIRGAEEEFLLGATISNLMFLARCPAPPLRKRSPPPRGMRINRMERISQERIEQLSLA